MDCGGGHEGSPMAAVKWAVHRLVERLLVAQCVEVHTISLLRRSSSRLKHSNPRAVDIGRGLECY